LLTVRDSTLSGNSARASGGGIANFGMLTLEDSTLFGNSASVGEGEAATNKEQSWNSRGHFFAAAAEAMRRILIERARHKKSLKAGGERDRVDLADIELACACPGADLLALDAALDKLAQRDRRKAELVKLRYFAGLTNEQAARALGISVSTADNDWAYARAWLGAELSRQGADSPS
jgi:RNA polymerase sigma factor (sigma-70 family)